MRKIGRFEETGNAEEHRLDLLRMLPQQGQRHTLREQRERQLVFPITQRRCDFLEERRITTVAFGHLVQASGFALQTKLRCRIEHTANSLFRQILQRRLTSTGAGQRNVCRKFLRQIRKIDAHLQHIAIRACRVKNLLGP